MVFIKVSEEDVNYVGSSYHRNLKKYVWKVNFELQLPRTAAWKVLRTCSHMLPYRLKPFYTLQPDDYSLSYNFASEVFKREDVFLII